MSQELVTVGPSGSLAAPQKTLFNQGPRDMVAFATEVANVLKDVIAKQRLFTTIQGKPHVKVEGWTTMGTILGILPREREVKELSDGSFEAIVDLVRQSDGCIVGGASSICGIDEKRWSSADRYARRSMAVTRATGKAYRLGFSWIMSLAGYEVTPAEEMPTIEVNHETPNDKITYIGSPKQAKEFSEVCFKHGVSDKATMRRISDLFANFY